jgi:hypothetical protein
MDGLAEADELVELVRVIELVVEILPVVEPNELLEEEMLVDVVETTGDTAACLIAPTKEMPLGDVV